MSEITKNRDNAFWAWFAIAFVAAFLWVHRFDILVLLQEIIY